MSARRDREVWQRMYACRALVPDIWRFVRMSPLRPAVITTHVSVRTQEEIDALRPSRWRRYVVTLVMLVACDAPQLPIALTRNGESLDELLDEVVDGCEVWGLACWATGDDYDGPRIKLDLRDGIPDGENGNTFEHRRCRKEAWVAAGNAKVVAHELGHLFWLHRRQNGTIEHSDDPQNIMFWHDSNAGETTASQRRTVRRNVGRFVIGCP